MTQYYLWIVQYIHLTSNENNAKSFEKKYSSPENII